MRWILTSNRAPSRRQVCFFGSMSLYRNWWLPVRTICVSGFYPSCAVRLGRSAAAVLCNNSVMKRPFSASVWREGNWYVSQCLEVDVASQGETEKEALASPKEGLDLCFEPPHATTPAATRRDGFRRGRKPPSRVRRICEPQSGGTPRLSTVLRRLYCRRIMRRWKQHPPFCGLCRRSAARLTLGRDAGASAPA